MRKGRGFQLKGFSTGNGKTHKANKTGRQFGTKILPGLSPLSYSPDGVKPNPPKSDYDDEEARDRANDIAHGDGISTPRPEATEPPPVDSGMPAVDPYSGDMTLSSMYGDQTWQTLSPKTRGILEDRRSKEGYNPAGDSSHPDSHVTDTYLTDAEKRAGGNYYKYNYNSDFSTNLSTSADRTGYNKDAMRHAAKSDAYRTTGIASYTEFDPITGERHTQEIRNPNFKPNNEKKVSLDTKKVQSVSSPKATTGKPTRSTQTKPTSAKTKPTSKKSTSYSDAYKKRDKKVYGNMSEAEYTKEAKRQKAQYKKTGKWDAPKKATPSKTNKKKDDKKKKKSTGVLKSDANKIGPKNK